MIDTAHHSAEEDNYPDSAKSETVAGLSFEKKFPKLMKFVDHIRCGVASEGTGTILIFRAQGRWKICLNDRPNARSAFVSHKILSEALQIADTGIEHGKLEYHQRGYRSRVESGQLKLPS